MTVTLIPPPPTPIDPAVACMVPVMDSLNYYLFDTAQFKREEFVTVDDPHDSSMLARYLPYYHVHGGIAHSAMMIVSGDKDTNCNRMHVGKTSGHFQRAESSVCPCNRGGACHFSCCKRI